MKLGTIVFAGLILLMLSPVLVRSQPTPKNGSDDHAVLESVRTSLARDSKVPLKLPTYFATEDEDYKLYATVDAATVAAYSVELALVPDCAGATACHWGEVAGKALKAGSRPPKGRAVKLVQNITGYFVDGKCGASCSDSTLTWDQAGHRYTVAIKAGKSSSLVKMANSAIKR